MGMTRAFYHIVNRGFSREEILDRLSAIATGESPGAGMQQVEESIRKRLSAAAAAGASPVAQEMDGLSRKVEEMCQRLGKDDMLVKFLNMAGALGGSGGTRPVVAYRKEAGFLPYFEVNCCEGYTASSRDNERLAQQFDAPVLSFSVVDSDALLVSYSDPLTGVRVDCANSNISEELAEELYDTEIYRVEFPDFLLEYCDEADQGKLRDIWGAHYVFEEDRMRDLGGLIGAEFLYDEEMPEGFEALEVS